jgi:prophage antirepressor-like protein
MNAASPVVPFYFQSNEVRTISLNNDPWFVAKDVCDVLELANVSRAVEGLDEDEKGVSKVHTLRGEQEMIIISESGLYTLIIRSNKPQAKPFRKWVTAEVLPSIRKTGTYNLKDSKTVKVNHTHLRGSMAPGGLDIRYTMDLSKIITRPNRTTIELLERLTGIQMTDVLLDAHDGGDLIGRFIDECYIRDDSAGMPSRILLSAVYSRFVAWYKINVEASGRGLFTMKNMSARMREIGIEIKPTGGKTWALGLEVRS